MTGMQEVYLMYHHHLEVTAFELHDIP